MRWGRLLKFTGVVLLVGLLIVVGFIGYLTVYYTRASLWSRIG
jgi:hypothetical protein